MESFIYLEDARRESRVFRGEYNRNMLHSAPSEVAAEHLDSVLDGNFDDADYAAVDLWSNANGTFVGRAKKMHKLLRCIQPARRGAGVRIPQNLLKLLNSLAKEPIAEPTLAIAINWKCLEAQHNAL